MPTRTRSLTVAAISRNRLRSLDDLSGGRALFGGADMGAVVPFVLWFNFLAGFAYVAAGLGLWYPQAGQRAFRLPSHWQPQLVFATFLWHMSRRAMGLRAFEARTARCGCNGTRKVSQPPCFQRRARAAVGSNRARVRARDSRTAPTPEPSAWIRPGTAKGSDKRCAASHVTAPTPTRVAVALKNAARIVARPSPHVCRAVTARFASTAAPQAISSPATSVRLCAASAKGASDSVIQPAEPSTRT
jgi:hypothetical protein